MKMNKLSAAVLATMLSLNAYAGAQGMGDTDEFQGEKEKKLEVRTHVVVNNNGQSTSKTETMVFPEKASFFTTSTAGVHFVSANETVKNAPYSAEATNETVQKLADGNTIVNKTSMLNFRDSAGRNRTETRNAKGETTQIVIAEPNGSVYMLNPSNKTATKIESKMPPAMGKMAAGGVREINVETTRKSKDGGENIEVRAVVADAKAGEKTVVIRRAGGADGEASLPATAKGITIDVRGPEPGAAMGVLAHGPDGAFMRLFADSKWASKKQTKSLGNKEMEGVKVEGKLSSYEIPAGEIGNAQAIVVSDEVWTSPELQLVVFSKHSDPRSGDRIYRLLNLKRDDIPASQFVVPNDYKVRDLAKELKVMVNDKVEKIEKAEKK